MARLNPKELEIILARNDVVSKYLGAITLKGLLASFSIPLEEAEIRLERYPAKGLFVTKNKISPEIFEKIKKGIWDAETNDFFYKGQPIALATEPIITCCMDKRKYILVGHTRARFLYEEDKNYRAWLLDIADCRFRDYLHSAMQIIGLKKIPELPIKPNNF